MQLTTQATTPQAATKHALKTNAAPNKSIHKR
jgi:hypothetical protein